ncbi:MAG TPA: SRPBCC family protein [Pyrinomonadaceae bacterium]|nr:SRPBCC family protein [Pyrinomonadaceae bacterium]
MATGTRRQQQGTQDEGERPENPIMAEQLSRALDDVTAEHAPPAGRELGDARRQGATKYVDPEQLARGLGWFSIGLGLAELLAPRAVAKVSGLRRPNTGLIRLFGLREIASGVAIFAGGRRPAGPVWSRVVGDALDLACLGAAYASPDNDKGRLTFATANVLAVTALDVLCAQQLSADDGEEGGGQMQRGAIPVNKSIVVNASPEELYQFWHDFENLPRFMRHLESVTAQGKRSHWVAKGPAGSNVEWDAEVTEDRPNELIAWRSLEGSEVTNAGTVRFERAPGGRGTVVHVEIDYSPPGGAVGALVAKLFGEDPDGQLQTDLRRFKQVIETGEVVISDATVAGEGYTEQRPAQPLGVGVGGGK